MLDPERVRYVTRNFNGLQGLKLLPFGLFMILIATRDLGWTWLGTAGDCSYTLPLFLLMGILYMGIGRYYSRRFGTVRQKDMESQWLLGIALVAVFFGMVVLEVAVKPPFSLIGLLISLLLVYSGIRTRRWYYWLVGLVLALLNLLPLLAGTTWKTFAISTEAAGTFGFWWNTSLGMAFCLLGLMDHYRLVSALKPLPGGNHA
jgi:hypothetical protein